MALNIIVTNAGRAALVNAANTGTAPVTITQVGISATATTPTAATTVLAGELKKIATISGEVVADDTIHVSVNDDSADAYTLRSFALYLNDGTLFAIYGQAGAILEKTASSIAALAIDAVFADIDAALITFGNTDFTNPPATTERQGVVELATVAETQAGTDPLRVITPAALKAALLALIVVMDGSGSGIDADLLDGQHGSYYADIAARLGFTPVNKAGDTMTGLLSLSANPTANLHAVPKQYADSLVTAAALLSKLLTVDGSGSGLDADLLDGFDSSYFTAISARLGYTPANKAGDTFGGAIRRDSNFYMDMSGSHPVVNFDGYDYFDFDRTADALTLYINSVPRLIARGSGDFTLTGTGNLTYNGNPVMHAGNDGAGSGFDADMLDGLHAANFLRSYVSAWVKSDDGNDRFYFGPTGVTYTRVKTSVRWQNTVNTDVASIDENGGMWLAAHLDAERLLVRASGTGQAIQIGDDAYLGDIDFTNTVCLKGVQNGSAGYIVFGNANIQLGCAASDSTLRYGGNAIMHAGNDGSGSGFDADMLDGLHASDFLRALAFTNAQNGSMRLSNGLLLVWGRWTSSASAGAATSISFFTSFSAEPYSLMLLPVVTTASTVSVWSSDGITGSAFPGRCSQASIGCRYFAIGPV